MKTRFSLIEGIDSLDLRRHSKMFSPSWRRSSPLSLMDLDMWDTKSRFAAQTSAWCGMETVSGSGFLSNVSTRTGGFRQGDPGLQRWQSLSHLAPESATRSCPPPGTELGTGRGQSSFRQAETMQWFQDAHKRLDAKLDQLRTSDLRMNYNATAAQMLDIKKKQLSKLMSAVEQDAAELPQFERTSQCAELREKVLKLENDLFQMRSALDKESNDEPSRPLAPNSLSRTLPETQEDLKEQGKMMVDTELCKLREAEERAATLEEERKKALQHLQKSAETQKTMLNQIEEMNKKFSQTVQNHSEVQEQLSEANNKISQACLEKAVLSTQVLKLEDNIRELKTKLTRVLSDKDQLMQEKEELLRRAQMLEMQLEKTTYDSQCELHEHHSDRESPNNQEQETVQIKKDSEAIRQVNEKLRGELDVIRQNLDISQCQLKELREERITNSKQISDLEEQQSQLIREKEELLRKINLGRHEVQADPKEKCCLHKESMEVLEAEIQKLQDEHLCLEAQVREKENMLHLQEEDYDKQDKMRVQCIEELKAVASHWAGKWQKVALTLQSTQNQLEELKRSSSTNERESESDSLLRSELDACKEELERERSRSQVLLQRDQDKGVKLVQNLDKEAVTDLSESSLTCEHPSDSHSCQNTSAQVWMESSETERLRTKLMERERELSEIEHAFRNLERLREIEKNEAQIKISALELKVKDEKPSAEGRKDKTNCPVNPDTEQQRRMVTEQLKSLFREREGKEAEKVANIPSTASPPQDWTPTSSVVRAASDRRNWQHGSGLMPVVEEDEENSDSLGEEEGDRAEETHAETSSRTAEISNLMAKNDSLLQALWFQNLQTAETGSAMTRLCREDGDQRWRSTPPLYPDGIFLAETVDVRSPDEEEDEEEGRLRFTAW